MDDVGPVQYVQAADHFQCQFAQFILCEGLSLSSAFDHVLEQTAVLGVFCDQVEMFLFVEGLLVFYHVGVGDVGEVEDLVEAIAFLLVGQMCHFHLFYRVDFVVEFAAGSVDD
jgi:hypothetical protein